MEAKKPVDPEARANVSFAASPPFLLSLQSSRVQKHTEARYPPQLPQAIEVVLSSTSTPPRWDEACTAQDNHSACRKAASSRPLSFRFAFPTNRINAEVVKTWRSRRGIPPSPGRKYHLLARICKLNMAQSERTSASSERRCAFNASVGALLADPPRQRGSGWLWLHSFSLHLCAKLEGCIGWQWIKRADNCHGAPDWSFRMPSLQLF